MRKMKKKMRNGGFTLIELLIVIGLLGALTALILPRLSASREDAIGDVCDYNQAGTLRVLNQYYDMYGKYPKDLHNGMTSTDSGAVAMPGLPDFQGGNMVSNITTTRHALLTNEATSLIEAGIESICSSNGLHSTAVATGVYVARCTTNWVDDSESPYTFNGMDIAEWESASGTPSWDATNGIVVTLWVAPTTDWSANQGDSGNNDWTKGAVDYGISLAGQCPVPTTSINGKEPDFAYYMAYFKVYSDGTKARLIGTSCPECGVLNP